MDAAREVEVINEALEGGESLTTPIWKGVYAPGSQFQIVYALGPRLLKVQLPDADENSWTKEIKVDSTEWKALVARTRQ